MLATPSVDLLESVAKLVAIPHVDTLCRLLSRYAGTTARDIRHAARMQKMPEPAT